MITFKRIFWKEARAQWQVWGGLLVIILLSQGLFFSVSLLEPVAQEIVVFGLFGVAVVLSVCYAAASASILVAGEREDETDFLLRTFPVPRSSLIGGKLAFTLASLLGLLGIGCASANLLSLSISGGTLRYPLDLANTLRSLGGAVAWGFFFSLLVDRVMVSLGLAVTTEIIVVGILGNFFPEAWRDPLYWLVVAAVLAVDLRMATRWVEGRPLLWEMSPGASPAASGPPAERSTRWLQLLRRLIATGNPEWRATRALLWRELRGAVPFMAVWGVVGVVMVDFGMRWMTGIPLNFFYLHLTPAACGLMAVLGDQRRGTQRFLGDHGVAPHRVWSVKIGTWLTIAVVLTVLFGWYDVAFAGRLVQGRGGLNDAWPVLRALTEEVRTPLMRLQGAVPPGTTVCNFALSLGLMLFAVGQWAGFLRSQPMVAGAITIGLSAATIAWHFFMAFAGVPLALSTWPLSLILFAATAWQVSPWLIGKSTGRFQLRDVGILVPITAVLIAVRHWRVTEIPLVPDSLSMLSSASPPSSWTVVRNNPLPTQVAISLQDPSSPRELPPNTVTKIYFTFRNPESASIIRSSAPRMYTGHQLVEMADVLVPSSKEESTIPGDPGVAEALGTSGGDEALAAAAAKPLDPATYPARWDGLYDLLAAADDSAARTSDWDQWSRAVERRQRLQQAMRGWGRLEGQTVANLDSAISDLLKTSLYVSPLPMLHRRNAAWHASLNDGLVPWIGSRPKTLASFAFQMLVDVTGERARSIRLADALTMANLAQESGRPLDPDHITLPDDPRSEEQRRQFAAWAESTFLVPPAVSSLDPVLNEVSEGAVTIQISNQVAARAGTILCLLLQRYRLEHGVFPPDLATATAHLPPTQGPDAKLLHDPFSGAEYQYRPGGFPAPLHVVTRKGPSQVAVSKILPANQPLLWSVGPGHALIEAIQEPERMYRASSRGLSYYFPIFHNDVAEEPAPGEVRFLILPP